MKGRRARRYGYPALIALTPDTVKFATLRSAFEPQPLAEFIESLRQARPSPTLPRTVNSGISCLPHFSVLNA
jgi:hypothetical protein